MNLTKEIYKISLQKFLKQRKNKNMLKQKYFKTKQKITSFIYLTIQQYNSEKNKVRSQ